MGFRNRNIRIFSSSSGEEVAGFFQHGGVSIATAIRWITEVCRFPGAWSLYPCKNGQNRIPGGPALDANGENDLPPGSYVICTPESSFTYSSLTDSNETEVRPISVSLTPETPLKRPYSDNYDYVDDNARQVEDPKFLERVRDRDQRCCITGEVVVGGDFDGFEAAHIFPLCETDIWNNSNLKRFIQDDQVLPGNEINSIQQGFLCSAKEHARFDKYSIGINPDENFRIYEFVSRDPNFTPHGKMFYRNLNVPQRYLPSADLLRDHFRQCLLANVKGNGEFDEEPDYQGGFNLSNRNWFTSQDGQQFESVKPVMGVLEVSGLSPRVVVA